MQAYHDDCVMERERALDDGEMEVSLIQNHMGYQENSLADLRNSHADLQERVRRLEDRGRGSNM